MKTLGLDIGTTTISAVVIEDSNVLSSITLKNDSFLSTKNPWERIQDPEYIRCTALQAISAMLTEHPDVQGIGVTGQMHGIVYLDAQGAPVSPLYTWQDGRGDLPFDEQTTHATYLSQLTGYSLATGFGFVTHFYNIRNGLVPLSASVFCTIHDYIAMVLANQNTPVTEPSNAASFGLFQVEKCCFDEIALVQAGIDKSILPALASKPCIGLYQGNIPVYVAIGDNQASFIGATGGNRNCMLVNVGTGSQFSVFSKDYMNCPGLETRPFPGGGYLLVGASLCGGRAYALMERFIRDVLESIAEVSTESCYDAMDKLLKSSKKPNNLPVTIPLFQGTRENPSLRGSITNLDPSNFTIRHLIWSLLDGMVDELYDMYLKYQSLGGKPVTLIGSGNGLRKNTHLQNGFAAKFGQPIFMSGCIEEAATGAALYASDIHLHK